MLHPQTREPAKFVGWRPRAALTLFGPVRFERAYYHVTAAAAAKPPAAANAARDPETPAAPGPPPRGTAPFDALLGLAPETGRLTRAAQEVVALTAGQAAFGRAARDLRRVTGLTLSEETARRVAETVGRRIGQRLAAGETFGPDQPWDWELDARGDPVAYVAIDATGIGMQGPGGAPAEGRMPYVAMVYNPSPRDVKPEAAAANPSAAEPCVTEPAAAESAPAKPAKARERGGGPVRYLAGLMGLAALGPMLRRQAAQVGMAQARRWIGLADGGAGLDAFLESNFPGLVLILDFWHAAEHLADFCKLFHADDPAAAAARLADWRHRLLHEGGLAVMRLVLNTDVQECSEAVRDRHRRLLEYLRSNAGRMDYPTYVANGWRIGSGPIEAACKQVVNARLCQAGMRWGAPGADEMCHLRALYRSEPSQWAAYWNLAA